MQEIVRNAANSVSEYPKHITTKSKVSVYDVFLCPSERPLEAVTTETCGRFFATSQGPA